MRRRHKNARRLTKVLQRPTGFTEGTNENYKLEHTWNAAGQRTQTKLTIRTQSAKQWDFAFTDDDQPSTVTNPDSEVTTNQYLDDGRPKKIILATGSTRELFYQDTDDSHAYVSAKNTHLRKTPDKKAAGTVICSFEYELDAAGNRVGMKDKDAKYTSYILDPSYQLKSETKWSAKTTAATRELQYLYAYDPNGNRITQQHDGTLTSYTIGDNNELTAVGASSLTYDQFGNTLTYGLLTFTWDSEGHMLTGTDTSAFPNKVDTHEVDGDGRRMRAKWANAADWTTFVYDELESSYPAILAEYTLISGTFTIKSLNTHGIGLVNTNREGTKRYFHFDGLGSTWALTDGSEVVQDTYTWSAFGVQEASSGSSVNPFRYVGRFGYYDDTARGSTFGVRCLGVRYYSPNLGRFLSWDPASATNAYVYVGNYVTCSIDPLGLRAQIPDGGFIPGCPIVPIIPEIPEPICAALRQRCYSDALRNYVKCMGTISGGTGACFGLCKFVPPPWRYGCYLLCLIGGGVGKAVCDLLLDYDNDECDRQYRCCVNPWDCPSPPQCGSGSDPYPIFPPGDAPGTVVGPPGRERTK